MFKVNSFRTVFSLWAIMMMDLFFVSSSIQRPV